MPVLWVYQLVAKPVLLAGQLAASKILNDTVPLLVPGALVSVAQKQHKVLSGPQVRNWTSLNHFLSPLQTPE